LFKKAKKTKLSLDEVYETMSDQGLFAILSGTDYPVEDILPAYCQRQAAKEPWSASICSTMWLC
ncbi:MAG: hypothetical protein RBU26_06765, partial [Sphaerochaeta sp.]|uniref:hypothetical protein n=1 Tax=Sphaerochaeta sp. TaxID=1972642 RepID=UPI002A371D92